MRPVIYGEVLYDVFPDSTAVLGGAPFNVAWHLQGLGLSPLFISRVGRDRHGDRILLAMDDWGMDTYAVTQDPVYPTGRVQVSLENGQPSFDIVADVAYDHIAPDVVKQLYDNPVYGPLYHGSLIYRLPDSAMTLSLLRQAAPSIFMDVNLRAPWWGKERIDELMQGIDWIKLNDVELQVLSGCAIDNNQDLEQGARDMLDSYNWQGVIVTRGARGAMLITSEQTLHTAPVEIRRLVDTVGAGDGFSAVWLAGLLQSWSYELVLQRAVEFASAICQLRGAVSQDEEFYRQYRQKWML